MAKHVHLHIGDSPISGMTDVMDAAPCGCRDNNTKDAGTSEGARKAAQTRKQGGSQQQTMHTYRSNGRVIGYGYHNNLAEANAHAKKQFGANAHATAGVEKRQPPPKPVEQRAEAARKLKANRMRDADYRTMDEFFGI